MGQQNAPSSPSGTFASASSAGILPQGATQLIVSSGNEANANAIAAFAALAGKTNWLTGFDATATGSTTAHATSLTVSLGGTTLSYAFDFPAGVLAGATPLSVRFNPPLPAAAADTAITVTLPAGGTGNTHAAVNAFGYQK